VSRTGRLRKICTLQLDDAAHVCDSKTRDGTTSACYLNDKTRTPREKHTNRHTQRAREYLEREVDPRWGQEIELTWKAVPSVPYTTTYCSISSRVLIVCICLSLSGFSQSVSRRLVKLQPTSRTWLQQSPTTKTKTKKFSTHKTQHSSPKPHPNNNPLEPTLSQNSHPLLRHSLRNPALSLSLSLRLSLVLLHQPASIHGRVTQPQGQPNAGSFSLLLFSHSRTALLVHSVSGADKTLMQLASNHGVRVGH
jgi:hypothetical protein